MSSATLAEATDAYRIGGPLGFSLPRGGAARRLVWSLFALGATATVAGLVLALLAEPSEADLGDRMVDLVLLSYPLAGAWIVSRRPENLVGWILCLTGVFWAAARFSHGYEEYAFSFAEPSLSGGEIAAWLAAWTWLPALFLMLFLLPVTFPDGKLPSRRWRPVAWLVAASFLLASVYRAFSPEFQDGGGEGEDNVLGASGAAADLVEALGFFEIIMPLSVLASFVAIFLRFRRGSREERQQLMWVVVAAGVLVVGFAVQIAVGDIGGVDPAVVGLVAFPVAITVAVLRYRLYEIDLILNRALVYGALTAIIVGTYVLVVGYLGALFDVGSDLPISLAAAGAVAVIFEPLRRLLQRTVNRLFYGYRDDPYRVLSGLGERLENTIAPDAVLPAIVDTVRQALRLPYAAIALRHGESDEIVAASGAANAIETEELPLTYQHEAVGLLILSPRGPGESFDATDRVLIADLARHAGVAAHAVRLTYDLQRSRERLVTAREEERRRLRRDLHDGLGPALAAVTLKADAARAQVLKDPAEAELLLEQLKNESQAAVADIRRLVYELRPPALDELGLVGALREQADRYGRGAARHNGGPLITVEAPEELPTLPAAVEVAAYRIAVEAMTNVSRHSQAQHCKVLLIVDDHLQLEIADDGRGISERDRAGVGISSMRERAAELGGNCLVVAQAGGGTKVVATLPLPRPPQ